jgi:hypothetical protein
MLLVELVIGARVLESLAELVRSAKARWDRVLGSLVQLSRGAEACWDRVLGSFLAAEESEDVWDFVRRVLSLEGGIHPLFMLRKLPDSCNFMDFSFCFILPDVMLLLKDKDKWVLQKDREKSVFKEIKVMPDSLVVQ